VTYSPLEPVATVEDQQDRKDRFGFSMAKSSFKLKILYGEGDAEVLTSQAESVQKAGHHVTTAVGRKGVEEALKKDAFDLVMLGPTLTRNDRHHLPYMVKKSHPGTRVLVMHADGGRHPYVDTATDTGRSIESILETIASMMEQQKAVAAQ
jgi:DNA-binding NtrC family response regulator